MYTLELGGEAEHRVWAYRKAAWAIEDTEQDLGLIYRAMGRRGLEGIESVGPKLAGRRGFDPGIYMKGEARLVKGDEP